MSDFNTEHQKQAAAVATLESMKYTWLGGIRWKPPLGKKPDFDLLDSLQAKIDKLQQQLITTAQAVPEGFVPASAIRCAVIAGWELSSDGHSHNHEWCNANQGDLSCQFDQAAEETLKAAQEGE